jgi:hypothetical protein
MSSGIQHSHDGGIIVHGDAPSTFFVPHATQPPIFRRSLAILTLVIANE